MHIDNPGDGCSILVGQTLAVLLVGHSILLATIMMLPLMNMVGEIEKCKEIFNYS